MEVITDVMMRFVLIMAFVAVYVGSIAWAIGDTRKRGKNGGVVIFLFWLFGPLAAIIWLIFRPTTRLDQRLPDKYNNAEDAIAGASKLDMPGDWSASSALYRDAAERWPEYADYIQRCIDRIAEKQAM